MCGGFAYKPLSIKGVPQICEEARRGHQMTWNGVTHFCELHTQCHKQHKSK